MMRTDASRFPLDSSKGPAPEETSKGPAPWVGVFRGLIEGKPRHAVHHFLEEIHTQKNCLATAWAQAQGNARA